MQGELMEMRGASPMHPAAIRFETRQLREQRTALFPWRGPRAVVARPVGLDFPVETNTGLLTSVPCSMLSGCAAAWFPAPSRDTGCRGE